MMKKTRETGAFLPPAELCKNTGGSNMSTKIIASDYDGTLCRDEGITEHDKAAIARWQTAGESLRSCYRQKYSRRARRYPRPELRDKI